MMLIATLLVLALIFFFLEIFLPGGVLALVGIACIIGAAAVATTAYGWIPGLLVFVGGGVVVILMFFIEVKWLLRSSWTRRIQHEHKIEGSSLKKIDVSGLVGLEVEALTPLTPSGRVRVNGEIMNAKSEDGWVDKGESVIIMGSDVFHIWVRKLD